MYLTLSSLANKIVFVITLKHIYTLKLRKLDLIFILFLTFFNYIQFLSEVNILIKSYKSQKLQNNSK